MNNFLILTYFLSFSKQIFFDFPGHRHQDDDVAKQTALGWDNTCRRGMHLKQVHNRFMFLAMVERIIQAYNIYLGLLPWFPGVLELGGIWRGPCLF
jgi:hypothetical protein